MIGQLFCTDLQLLTKFKRKFKEQRNMRIGGLFWTTEMGKTWEDKACPLSGCRTKSFAQDLMDAFPGKIIRWNLLTTFLGLRKNYETVTLGKGSNCRKILNQWPPSPALPLPSVYLGLKVSLSPAIWGQKQAFEDSILMYRAPDPPPLIKDIVLKKMLPLTLIYRSRQSLGKVMFE